MAPSASVELDAARLRLRGGARRIALDHPEVIGFRDGNAENDRIDRGNRRQQCAFTTPDQAPRLYLRRADQAIDRCRDPRVAEIEFCFVQRGARRFDLRLRRILFRTGVVKFLLTDRLFRDQRRVARDVAICFFEPGGGDGDVGVRLCDGGFEGRWIDLIEQIALANERAFTEVDAVEKSFDARADIDVLESLGLADQIQVHRHVLLHHRRDVHLGWRRGDSRWFLARSAQHGHGRQRGDAHRSSVRLHAPVLPYVSGLRSAAAMPLMCDQESREFLRN